MGILSQILKKSFGAKDKQSFPKLKMTSWCLESLTLEKVSDLKKLYAMNLSRWLCFLTNGYNIRGHEPARTCGRAIKSSGKETS